ncbi:MAG: hypothetical protein KF716_15210 [Anaerolineae bacterium]|nr:hypothetical protein [Anaerolineae bacterium]
MDAVRTNAIDEIAEFLLTAPTLEQVIAFKASAGVQERLDDLLERNKTGQLTADEHEELDETLQLDLFVQFLKAKAKVKLANK